MDDFDLIRRCIAGDESAWNRLVSEYAPRVDSLLNWALPRFRISVQPSDVETIRQQLFVRLWENDRRLLKEFDGRGPFFPWLRAVTLGTARNWVKQTRRAESRREPFLFEPPSDVPGPLDRMIGEEARMQARAAWDSLPTRDRLLLQYHYADGATHREIAAVLRLSPESIGSLLHRALKKWKTAYQRQNSRRETPLPPGGEGQG